MNLKQKYDRSPNAAQEARYCYAKKYVFHPSAMGRRADTVNSFSSKPNRHQDSEQSVTA